MNPKLLIDCRDGDHVLVTGKREDVARAVDLSNCRYLEIDGYITAEMFDPVPSRGREEANFAVRECRVNGAGRT